MNPVEFRTTRPQAGPRSGVGWLLVVIALIVGAIALLHTVTRNQTVAVGRQQAGVEREIAALEQELRALDMKIEEALSRKNLSDRLASQRTKLRDITPDTIVLVPPTPAPCRLWRSVAAARSVRAWNPRVAQWKEGCRSWSG